MASIKALVICYSEGDQTHHVAEAMVRGLAQAGAEAICHSLDAPADQDPDLCSYDLVCMGSPCYRTGLPLAMQRYLARLGSANRAEPRAHSWGMVFFAYGSPHTNLDQAQDIAKAMAMALKGTGRDVRGCWGVVGAFGGPPTAQGDRLGWLGNLQGQMYQQDLDHITAKAAELAQALGSEIEND